MESPGSANSSEYWLFHLRLPDFVCFKVEDTESCGRACVAALCGLGHMAKIKKKHAVEKFKNVENSVFFVWLWRGIVKWEEFFWGSKLDADVAGNLRSPNNSAWNVHEVWFHFNDPWPRCSIEKSWMKHDETLYDKVNKGSLMLFVDQLVIICLAVLMGIPDEIVEVIGENGIPPEV